MTKQDYKTPPEFIAAVEKRFGPIGFDLAAHAGNKQHAKYFAPPSITLPIIQGITTASAVLAELRDKGCRDLIEVLPFAEGNMVFANNDPEAAGIDAFKQDWSKCARGDEILWLNCEFGDCAEWAAECVRQSRNKGVRILLLTPASVGSNWARDIIFPHAEIVTILSGRISFAHGAPFPKDCMLSLFTGDAPQDLCIWDWRKDKVHFHWDVSNDTRKEIT